MQNKCDIHQLGTGTQLLIDDHVVDDIYRIISLPEMPIKHQENPVFNASGTVLYDQQEKVYKMWYGIPSPQQYISRGCYALSGDGIHWEEPDLGIVKDAEYCNIVKPNGFGPVMKDLNSSDPQRRYKMWTKRSDLQGGKSGAAFSPDGIHWTDHPDERSLIRGSGDGGGMVVYDEHLGKYVNFRRPTILACPKPTEPEAIGFPDTRAMQPADGGFPSEDDFVPHGEAEDYIHRYLRMAPYVNTKALRIMTRSRLGCNRRIARAESEDFIHWSEPEVIIRPDALDPPKLYSMSVSIYKGVYIGFLQVYHSWGWRADPGCPQEPETMDVHLAFSRDGKKWERLANRPVFIQRGRIGSFDGGMIHSVNLVDNGDEIRLYYTGSRNSHNIGPSTPQLGVAKLPRERFVARTAGDELGALITKPFYLTGNKLRINANAAKGLIKAEVTTPIGESIAGFDAANCSEIKTDGFDIPLQWKNGEQLDALSGQPIRLRFYMWQARLYSFTVEA